MTAHKSQVVLFQTVLQMWTQRTDAERPAAKDWVKQNQLYWADSEQPRRAENLEPWNLQLLSAAISQHLQV